MGKILIIEDNPLLCRQLSNWLGKKGLEVEYTFYAAHARKRIAEGGADIILSDIRLSDGDGVDILEWMDRNGHRIPFIIMTDYAAVSSAVRAMKLGAVDYFSKPLDLEELFVTIGNLLKNAGRKKRQPELFRRSSRKIQEAEKHAGLVAKTDMSVLILGENGTGKEHVANLIHQSSGRAGKPFVPVDCGAIPKELSASEFFGHVKGAFTGATENKTGAFHEAEGGTLFLDEIGNLSYEVQSSLLRVLQEKRYRPVGGKKEVTADVRILAATNENMKDAIDAGRFRMDLYHRICEFEIRMPTLSECREDILPLAGFFLKQYTGEMKKDIRAFDAEAGRVMQSHNWSGNVRELKNRVQRAVLLAESDTIGIAELGLNPGMADGVNEISDSHSLKLKREEEERERVAKAFEVAKGNKTQAAKLLGTTRPTFYKLLEKHGIR